jgi:hypothetical protein
MTRSATGSRGHGATITRNESVAVFGVRGETGTLTADRRV